MLGQFSLTQARILLERFSEYGPRIGIRYQEQNFLCMCTHMRVRMHFYVYLTQIYRVTSIKIIRAMQKCTSVRIHGKAQQCSNGVQDLLVKILTHYHKINCYIVSITLLIF